MRKTKEESIHLGTDGELWGIPPVQEVQNERLNIEAEKAAKQAAIEKAESELKDQMERIMARLEELNYAFNQVLFLEVADQDKRALIGRRPYREIKEQEETFKAYYLVITQQGFYELHFPGRYNQNADPVLFPNQADFGELVSVLPTQIDFRYQYIVFNGEKLRLSLSGTPVEGGFSYGFSSGDLERLIDEQLIQACLDQALLPIEEEKILAERSLGAQDERLDHVKSLLTVASNIDNQLASSEIPIPRRWWPFGFRKRKRQSD